MSTIIDRQIHNELTAQAQASPRLRMNLDLRNSPSDKSQRMLNAIEPGTVMPIYRHRGSSETVVCIRGHFEGYFYDEDGVLVETVDMVPGGVVLNVPVGRWHSLKSLESGTVLLEGKDGAYEPLGGRRHIGIMDYSLSSNNIQLKSSFKVKKDVFERKLLAMREEHPECLVWNRSIKSLKYEWAAHNAFHALGVFRTKTADVDLDWPQNWLFRIGYAVAGAVVWPFIK